MNKRKGTNGLIVLLVLGVIIMMFVMTATGGERTQSRKYSEIVSYFEQGIVDEFTLNPNSGAIEMYLDTQALEALEESGGQEEQPEQTNSLLPQLNRQSDETVTQDTVWFAVRPLGLVPDHTCRIKLEQYEGTEWEFEYGADGGVVDSVLRVIPRQAEPGVHYVPFDDERMEPWLTLEPGEMEARIPVIVLRDETLSDTTYTLFFRIADSEDLYAGVEELCCVELRIADCLSRPSAWDDWFFAGTWSATRHEFMIEVTGEPWDDEFIGT